jgi:hypothetical protein
LSHSELAQETTRPLLHPRKKVGKSDLRGIGKKTEATGENYQSAQIQVIVC